MCNFGAKNMGDNIGKIVYQNYPTTRFRLQHGSATWTWNIVMYRGSSAYNFLEILPWRVLWPKTSCLNKYSKRSEANDTFCMIHDQVARQRRVQTCLDHGNTQGILDCYTALCYPETDSHWPAILEGNPSSDVSISITRKSPPENSWPKKIFLFTFLPANHRHAHSGLWRALSLESEWVQQARGIRATESENRELKVKCK